LRGFRRRQAVPPFGAFLAGDTLDGKTIAIYSENAGLTSLLYRQVRFALLMIHRLCAAWLLYGLLCGCQSAAIAFQSKPSPHRGDWRTWLRKERRLNFYQPVRKNCNQTMTRFLAD
jgi:hypothetical protein